MSNLKTAVVCIARLEGKYINEWVNYYLGLGFDKIIIADNNHDEDDEDLGAMFKDNPNVIVEDYRNKVGYQMKCYTELYQKYKNDFSWIAFLDIDEYLELPQHGNIKEYLKDKSDFECVMVNWLCFGDNEQIYADYSKPIQERFPQPLPVDIKVQYNFAENFHIKSILKGGLENAVFQGNPHCTDNHLKCCNASGIQVNNMPWQAIDYRQAYIKHYVTKSLEEFYTNKMKRGTGDRDYKTFIQFYANRYFQYNKPTQEKLDWLKEHGYSGI